MTRLALAALGFYVCLLGAVVHRQVWHGGDVSLPWGLVLVVVVTWLVAVAANRVVRIGSAWLTLGWALGLLALQWSPGESYLIASDWPGVVFMAGCLGAIVLAVVRAPR